MKCISCENELQLPDQKKFCSRSCAAKHNNKVYPKRKGATQNCSNCNVDLGKKWKRTRKLCNDCLTQHHLRNSASASLVAGRTLGEYLELHKTKSISNRYCGIRNHASKVINRSGRPKVCAECGYSNHVEICHIKGIAEHSPDTKVSEINDLSNLIYLCPNHHWEFDNKKRMVRSKGIEPFPKAYEVSALPSELTARVFTL